MFCLGMKISFLIGIDKPFLNFFLFQLREMVGTFHNKLLDCFFSKYYCTIAHDFYRSIVQFVHECYLKDAVMQI